MARSGRYRLYALDHLSELAGYQVFSAQTDWQAREVGHALFKACNDQCISAEIWKGHRRIARFETDDGGRLDRLPIDAANAALIFEVAETLANSNWAIARSKRLAAILAARED